MSPRTRDEELAERRRVILAGEARPPAPGPDEALSRLERRIHELYADGHVTGYGAGRASHDRAGCDGCAEVRDLAGQWDARWDQLDAARTRGRVD